MYNKSKGGCVWKKANLNQKLMIIESKKEKAKQPKEKAVTLQLAVQKMKNVFLLYFGKKKKKEKYTMFWYHELMMKHTLLVSCTGSAVCETAD